MKINFFKYSSPLYTVRWYIVYFAIVILMTVFFDITGMRMFSFSGGKEWKATGASGFHK